MKCKRVLMGYAALLVVFFHFYIIIFRNPVENFIYRSSYIGVDIFFLVSAYSQGRRDKTEYLPFIKNRLKSVYLPFVIMSAVAFIYKKWTWIKFFQVITGVDFFRYGGGSFLWFAPGIMLFYLISPFLVKAKKRFGLKSLGFMAAGWFLICAVMQYGFGYTKPFILLNRLPAFFAGLFYDEICSKKQGKLRIPADILLLVAGCAIVFRFGTNIRLNKPLADFYYVAALPLIFAVTDIFELITEKINLVPLAFVGTITLELYGLQMIFGYDIENMILKKTQSPVISFAGVVIILIIMAYIFSRLMKLLMSACTKLKELVLK